MNQVTSRFVELGTATFHVTVFIFAHVTIYEDSRVKFLLLVNVNRVDLAVRNLFLFFSIELFELSILLLSGVSLVFGLLVLVGLVDHLVHEETISGVFNLRKVDIAAELSHREVKCLVELMDCEMRQVGGPDVLWLIDNFFFAFLKLALGFLLVLKECMPVLFPHCFLEQVVIPPHAHFLFKLLFFLLYCIVPFFPLLEFLLSLFPELIFAHHFTVLALDHLALAHLIIC